MAHGQDNGVNLHCLPIFMFIIPKLALCSAKYQTHSIEGQKSTPITFSDGKSISNYIGLAKFVLNIKNKETKRTKNATRSG